MNTLAVYAGSWFDDMLGLRLGWQDVTLPRILIVCVAILGCFTAVKSAGEPTYFKPGKRTVAIAAAVCCSLMIMAALFLVYTPEGAQFIYGVQGRYFLPLLPLFMLGIRTDAIRRRDGSERWIVFGAAVLNYWAIGCIIAEVMSRSGVMKMLGAS